MRPLVIVRPQPGASATAKAARQMGLDARTIPLFAIEPVEWAVPDVGEFDALVFTSANAIREAGAGLERLRELEAHCVGEATAAAALEAGFAVATTGRGGVDALLGELPPGLRLLHLCGVHWHEPAAEAQAITHVPVYRSVGLPVGPELRAVEGAVVAIHSPRSAATLARAVDEAGIDRAGTVIAAISRAAAAAAGQGWERIEVASEPADSALLPLAAELCNNPR
jgi:uroporphyrinogen-III synthase